MITALTREILLPPHTLDKEISVRRLLNLAQRQVLATRDRDLHSISTPLEWDKCQDLMERSRSQATKA